MISVLPVFDLAPGGDKPAIGIDLVASDAIPPGGMLLLPSDPALTPEEQRRVMALPTWRERVMEIGRILGETGRAAAVKGGGR